MGRIIPSTNTKGKQIPLYYLFFLIISALEIPLGFIFDISIFSLLTFVCFLIAIYRNRPQILVTYVWYFVMAGLNVIGVFSCEIMEVDLYEITKISHYANALSTIVFIYILFFLPIAVGKNDFMHKKNDSETSQNTNLFLLKIMLVIGVLLELYLFFSIFDKPYFALGVNRTDYSRFYLSSDLSTIKGWLPIFLPCAVIAFKNRSKVLPALFTLILFLIYIWVGDKFGSIFFALSILICCSLSLTTAQRGKLLKKGLIILVFIGIAIFLIGLIQRILIYDEGIFEYLEYLFARLAQQGQIWWSVFENTLNNGPYIDELSDSFNASFSQDDSRNEPYAGQWKMMLAASDYALYALGRVEVGVAYTATTQATIFYYFSWFGLIVFPLLGLICKKIIDTLINAVSNGDFIVAMLLIKILTAFNALYTASEVMTLFTPANILVVALLILMTIKPNRDLSCLAIIGSTREKRQNALR